jgi:hypothetical protein
MRGIIFSFFVQSVHSQVILSLGTVLAKSALGLSTEGVLISDDDFTGPDSEG